MNYVSNLGLVLAVISLIGLGAAGLGYRWGWWGYKTGISIVKCSGFASAVAVVACLVGVVLWNRNIVSEGQIHALLGLIVGGGVLTLTLKWKHKLEEAREQESFPVEESR